MRTAPSPACGRASSTIPRVTRTGRMLAVALARFVVGVVFGLVVLWPAHQHHRGVRSLGAPASLVNATVASVDTSPCPAGGGQCSTVFIRVTSGPDHGHTAI